MFDIKRDIAAYLAANNDEKKGWVKLIYEWALIEICRHIPKYNVDFGLGFQFSYSHKNEKGINGVHWFTFDNTQTEIIVRTYTGKEADKIKAFQCTEIEQAIELFVEPVKVNQTR